MLTNHPVRPEYFNRVPLVGETFEHYLGNQPNQSFYIYFSQNRNKVIYRYKSSDGSIKEEKCDIPIEKKFFSMFIKVNNNLISLNYHDNTSNNYSKCGIIDIGNDRMTQFYFSMMARCSSQIRYDITAMSLGTDFENVQVSEFETIYDETLPKLFKKINYYINTDYLTSPDLQKYDENEDLNIEQVIQKQQEIFKNLDDTNYYLTQNLEETSDLVERIDLHKATAENSITSIVDFLKNWMVKSNEQLNDMENDLLNAETTLKEFNLDDVVKETTEKIDSLKNKIQSNKEFFDKYKDLNSKLTTNKKKIESSLNEMKGFKEKLKKYLDKTKRRKERRGKISFN